MRNSDPRVSMVRVQKPNSDLNSILTVQVTGCNFLYGPNLCVPLDRSFRLWCFFFSWKSVLSTNHCICELWEICSVFCHEVLSNFNSEILHPHKICWNLSGCDSFSVRSPYSCKRRSLRAKSSKSRGTLVLITLSTSEELDCPITTGLPVLSWRDSYSSHISATAPLRLSWFAQTIIRKNSLNRFLDGSKVNRQFTMSFAFELTSGLWSRTTENWTSAFCESHQHPFSNTVPLLLVDWRTANTKLSCALFRCVLSQK